jgi:ribosomal protein S18 acetylase RimI-like enzyme
MMSISPYILRPLTPADFTALCHAIWSTADPDAVSEMLTRVLDRVARDRAYAVIAVSPTDELIGYGQLTHWAQVAEISDLNIVPTWRNQGIGTVIIKHLETIAMGWGCPVVEIGSAATNEGALRLYKRLGYGEHRRLFLDLGRGPEMVIYLRK